MNIISFYAGEDEFLFEMDWEEHIAETPNSKILCHLLCKAHNEYYLQLGSIMLFQIAFNHIDFLLLYETSLLYIRIEINKIMEQNRVTREPYHKKVLGGREIYYSKET